MYFANQLNHSEVTIIIGFPSRSCSQQSAFSVECYNAYTKGMVKCGILLPDVTSYPYRTLKADGRRSFVAQLLFRCCTSNVAR